MVKAIWINLHSSSWGIIFKLSGERCQCQDCVNTKSPWQNSPNKFPCGRKRITQETELTFHAWAFVCTQGVTYKCLCELWAFFTHWICFWRRNTSEFKDQKIKLDLWDCSSFGICFLVRGLLRGEVKGRSDLERTQFPAPCLPLLTSLLGSLRTAEWSPH